MEGLLPDTVLATVRGKQGQHGGGKAPAKTDNSSSTKVEGASKSQVGAKGLSTSRSGQPNASKSLANAQNNTKNKDGMKQSKGGAKVTPGIKLRESHTILANPKAKSNNLKNESNKSQRNATNSKPAKENLKQGKEHSKAGKENLRHSKVDAKQKPKQTLSKSGPTKQIKKVSFEPHPAAPLEGTLSWDYDESKVEFRKKRDIANLISPIWEKADSCLDPTEVSHKTSGVDVYGDGSHFHGEDIQEKSEAVILSSPAKTPHGEKGECRNIESVTASSEHTNTIRVEPITDRNTFGASEPSLLATELSVSSIVEPNAIVDVKGPFTNEGSCAEPSSLIMESPADASSNPPLEKTGHSPQGSTENEIVPSPLTQKCTQSTEKDAPEKEDLPLNEGELVGHPPPGFCLRPEDNAAEQNSNVTAADGRSISASHDNAPSYLQSNALTDNDVCYMDNKTSNLAVYDELSIDPLNCDKEDVSQHSCNGSPKQFALFPSGTSSETTAAEVDQKSPKTVSGKNDEYHAAAILNQERALHTRCSVSRDLHSHVEEDAENFTRTSAPDTCKTVDPQLEEFAELQDLPSDRVDVGANNRNSGLYEGLVGSNDQKSDDLDYRPSQFEYSIEKSGIGDKHFEPHNLWGDGESQCLRYEPIDESSKRCIEMTEVGIDEGIPASNTDAQYRTSGSEADPDLKPTSGAPLDYAAPGQPDETPSKNVPSEFGSSPCEHPDGVMNEDVKPEDDGMTCMAYMLAPTAEGLETALVDYPDGTVKDVDGCMYMPHGQINMPEMPLDAQPCDIRLRNMPAAERYRMHYLEDHITAAHVEILNDFGSGGTYSHLYQKLLEIKRLEDQYEKFMNDHLKF